MADLSWMSGLTNNGGGGGTGRGVSRMEINENGELVVTYTDGMSEVLGTVVGKDGKVYVPSIDEHKILKWNIEDKASEVPDPVDLNPQDEWSDMEDEVSGKSDYSWDDKW